jgi:KipI family sensor histidine kinase inhibitor
MNDTAKLPRITLFGETAVLFEAATTLDLDVQRRIWTFAEAVGMWRGVVEVVPGIDNLLVIYEPRELAFDQIVSRLAGAWLRTKPLDRAPRVIEIPVVYGGEDGPDLPAIAATAGLSVQEAAAIHAAPDYMVCALGSQPGFGYLAGLDPRLATPRRSEPRLDVRAGAVVIGGSQAGVIARASPSGWHIVGQTPVEFFDLANPTPALLAPGDTVRFRIEQVLS